MAHRTLCQTCKRTILEALSRVPDLSTVRWRSVRALATIFHPEHKLECYLCMQMAEMAQATKDYWDHKDHSEVAFRLLLYLALDSYGHTYDLQIEIDIPKEAAGVRPEDLDRLYQIDRWDKDDALRSSAFLSSLQFSTGSEASYSLAQSWYNDCLSSHQCRQNTSTTWMPKRLLHLQQERARLINSADEIPGGPYATLSHCWGGDVPMKLTSENYDVLAKGLPFETFSPSFRDAMLVTKRLGIQYIWIDSFCIIQGSDEASAKDWDEQSVQMGEVYANGVINIGATVAQSSKDGCFVRRNRAGLEWSFVDDEEKGMAYRISDKGFFIELDEEPLLKRAWVIQERHLSTRMIHFGGRQLFWQCAEIPIASELSPRGLNSAGQGRQQDYSEYLIAPGEITKDSRPLSLNKRQNAWEGIIGAYCDADLTFPGKDKLRAIQGIGDALARQLRAEYHDGFLSHELPQALCWNTHSARLGRLNRNRRAVDRGYPSWSWASMDGSLNFRTSCDEVVEPLATVIHETRVSLPLAQQTIICIGRLIPVSLQTPVVAPHRRLVPPDYYQEAYVGDPNWARSFFFDDKAEMDMASTTGTQLYVLPICSNLFSRPYINRTAEKERTSFLVIRQDDDGAYRRIGARRTLDDYANREIKGSWAEAYRNSGASLIVLV